MASNEHYESHLPPMKVKQQAGCTGDNFSRQKEQPVSLGREVSSNFGER